MKLLSIFKLLASSARVDAGGSGLVRTIMKIANIATIPLKETF